MENHVETLTTAEAQRRLAELVARAAAGERFLIGPADSPAAILIGAGDYEAHLPLATALTEQAAKLGQDQTILRSILEGGSHPLMAAYGMWRDEHSFDTLADDVYANRLTQPSRADISL